MEAIGERGGDASRELQMPLAILTLTRDSAVCCGTAGPRRAGLVLTRGLETMGYGRRFLASLPPAPVTHDVDDITRFFKEYAADDVDDAPLDDDL